MQQVTRLTQSGKLNEATEAIQRTLGSRPSGGHGSESDADECATIEGSFRVVDTDASAVQTDARYLEGSFTNAAGTRAYKLYVPSGCRAQAPRLVVMLHGCTQHPDDFSAGTRMNLLAEEHACLVLYPAQARAANAQRCWNWFKDTNQRRDAGEPSIIAGLTREILGTYAVDPLRVYVAGLSAGGAMAAVMGATYPDLYAAVGVHSGLAYGAARDLPSALTAMKGRANAHTIQFRRTRKYPEIRAPRLIVFHGDEDTVVHPRNGEQLILQGAEGYSAASGSKPRVSRHAGQIPGGRAYTRDVYRTDDGQLLQEHWMVHGTGHAWSGGSPDGSHTDPKGPDAAREMLRFFEEIEAAGHSNR